MEVDGLDPHQSSQLVGEYFCHVSSAKPEDNVPRRPSEKRWQTFRCFLSACRIRKKLGGRESYVDAKVMWTKSYKMDK